MKSFPQEKIWTIIVFFIRSRILFFTIMKCCFKHKFTPFFCYCYLKSRIEFWRNELKFNLSFFNYLYGKPWKNIIPIYVYLINIRNIIIPTLKRLFNIIDNESTKYFIFFKNEIFLIKSNNLNVLITIKTLGISPKSILRL